MYTRVTRVVSFKKGTVIAMSRLNVGFNNRGLFGGIGLGFINNGYCNIVNTGNTNGSAFLHVLSKRLRPAANRIVVSGHAHVSILGRSRCTCSRFAILSAVVRNGPHLCRIVGRGSRLCTGRSFASRSNTLTTRLRNRFTRVGN